MVTVDNRAEVAERILNTPEHDLVTEIRLLSFAVGLTSVLPRHPFLNLLSPAELACWFAGESV